MGNGINEDHWSAEGPGADMKLSKTLAPLEPLKQKINVIDGLFIKALTGQGIHPAQTGSLLSGAHISKGAIIHSGISVDQMIANRVGQDTPQSSIVLACEQPMTGYHETNFSHGVQLAHFVAERPIRRCPWKSIPRSPGTICLKTAAACSTSAFSTASRIAPQDLTDEDQRHRQDQARRISHQRP